MALYGHSFEPVPVNILANAFPPIFDVMAAATHRPAVVEVGIVQASVPANSVSVLFGRAANTPVQLSPATPLPEDGNDLPSQTRIGVAWSTAPIVPNIPVRRAGLNAAIGHGVIWTFPRGFAIASGASAAAMVGAGAFAAALLLSAHVVVNE